MRKLLFAAALAVVTAVASFADIGRTIGNGPDEFGGYTTEYILVRFKSGQTPRRMNFDRGTTGNRNVDRLSAKWGVSRIDVIQPGGYGNPQLAERLGLSRTFMFDVRQGTDVRRMVEEFSALRNVEFAEVDGIGGTAFQPNDPLIGECYGLNNTGQTGGVPDADIDAFECWDTWRGGSNIVLAILDTGVLGTHPELVGKMVPGWNTNNNTNQTGDQHGHGTHVSGTAGAHGNNGIGIAGVSFGTRIMPMRVLSAGGNGTEAQCGAGMVWAADHGANICSMSLQYYTGSQTFQDNVNYAFNMGVLLIAATGNNQGNVVAFPARFPNCQGVGATTHTDAWANFSNFGPQCDISAPGQDVYSLFLGNSYTEMSGTSMATPHVSGLASLIWSYDRGLTNVEVFTVLTTTADDKGPMGWDQQFGWGRLNANRAILKAREPLTAFTNMTVDQGIHTGGVVGNLFDSDDVKVTVDNRASRANDGVMVTVSGNAPLIPYNRLQVLLETSATINATQRVLLFNFVQQIWEEVDVRMPTTGDSYTIVNVTTNPARFLSPGTNTVSARVVFDSPALGSRSWSTTIDQFRVALRNN
jgi:thermitase